MSEGDGVSDRGEGRVKHMGGEGEEGEQEGREERCLLWV